MSIDDLLLIAEKIDYGIRDFQTTDRKFQPLWQHPFLLEVFLSLLQATSTQDEAYEHSLTNFKTVCSLLCPDFLPILQHIEPVLADKMLVSENYEIDI